MTWRLTKTDLLRFIGADMDVRFSMKCSNELRAYRPCHFTMIQIDAPTSYRYPSHFWDSRRRLYWAFESQHMLQEHSLEQ
jgi:hypothetical protein